MKLKLLILFVLALFSCIHGQSDTTETETEIDNEIKMTTEFSEIAESDLVRNSNNNTNENDTCSSCSSFPKDTSLDTKIDENVSKNKNPLIYWDM